MTWIKANIKWIVWALIAIAALILFWIIFHKAPTPNDHTDEKRKIDSLYSVITILKKQSNGKISLDSAAGVKAKAKADSLQLSEKTWYAKAKTFEANAKHYELLYTQAKGVNDSETIVVSCDQIIQIVDSQTLVINNLHIIGDSIEVQNNIQLNLKDSIIQTTQALLSETDKALTQENNAYQGLNKDYDKQVKANKTNRTLARGLAAVVLILGTILVLK